MSAPLWLTVTVSDLPDDDAWLGLREHRVLAGLKIPDRRRDWMLGRWAAKRASRAAVTELGGSGEAEVEIITAPDGAPEAWVDGQLAPFSISISHRGGFGACLVAGSRVRVGCDVELVEPRAAVFAADWFTSRERALVVSTPPDRRDLVVTLVWSAKESVLKVLRQGLRLDPRDVEVQLTEPDIDTVGWQPLVAVNAGHCFEGWWRREGKLVMTAVMDPAGMSPQLVTESCDKKENV